MNRLRRRWQARAARRETLVLALLTYHGSDGLTGYELWHYIRGPAPALYVTLERLRLDGRIRAWWTTSPRRRLYALPEGEVR